MRAILPFLLFGALVAQTLTASDGQTLEQQSARTQQIFRDNYGDQADAQWVAQHNQIVAQNSGFATSVAANNATATAEALTPALATWGDNQRCSDPADGPPYYCYTSTPVTYTKYCDLCVGNLVDKGPCYDSPGHHDCATQVAIENAQNAMCDDPDVFQPCAWAKATATAMHAH